MGKTFEQVWSKMSEQCPHSIHADTADWAKWMLNEGYAQRLHGGVLNVRIVAAIVAISERGE